MAGRFRFSRITRDITGRKEVELALAERDTQLELAAQVALVGSFTYDIELGMTRVKECARDRQRYHHTDAESQ